VAIVITGGVSGEAVDILIEERLGYTCALAVTDIAVGITATAAGITAMVAVTTATIVAVVAAIKAKTAQTN
jgi:hypothetical protein